MDDPGGDEAQAGCPEALILEGPVTDFALAVEEDRTAQGVAGLALLRPAWLRWRSSGSDNHCRVNRVRSIRPSARKARDRVLPAPAAPSLRKMTEGMTLPAWIDALSRTLPTFERKQLI